MRYPKSLKRLRSIKLAKWRAFKDHHDDAQLKASYKAAAANFNRAIQQWRNDRKLELVSNMNQSSFFKYATTKLRTSRQSSILIDDSGRVIASPLDIANEFNKYFASVFTVDNGNLPDFPVRVNKELNFIRFDVLSISKVLKNLKPSVSFGLDNTPNVFFAEQSDPSRGR